MVEVRRWLFRCDCCGVTFEPKIRPVELVGMGNPPSLVEEMAVLVRRGEVEPVIHKCENGNAGLCKLVGEFGFGEEKKGDDAFETPALTRLKAEKDELKRKLARVEVAIAEAAKEGRILFGLFRNMYATGYDRFTFAEREAARMLVQTKGELAIKSMAADFLGTDKHLTGENIEEFVFQGRFVERLRELVPNAMSKKT